ncbi:MAG TPA: hypothetical protein PKD09_13910 [Aggregatilinea sp.]|jgi:hypothetical protein|uniref:hypothetical protein n=1 Tax=Aggregatilinea sp. TaxID=2806333 RepID=UPI002C38EA75|nr:hypothetical protein [Aggregatilinea sp.]HML22740.1 hypothetical protein [Aggregatilinea sp.]
MAAVGYLFLVLFLITLFVTYLAVRRALGPTLYIGGASIILSIIFIVLYSLLVQENSAAQALFAGIVGGVVFDGIAIALASFFRTNQPLADVELASYPAQEPNPNERRNDYSDSSPE